MKLNNEELKTAIGIVRNKHPDLKEPGEVAVKVNDEFFTEITADDVSLIDAMPIEDFSVESRKIEYYNDRYFTG